MVLVLLLVGATPGCGIRRAAVHATMTVTPAIALYDAPVTGSVSGLPPRARTTVTATATDADGVTWSASAEFQANRDGVVSFDQAPLGGSYPGADPMGLFHFMTPANGDSEDLFFAPPVTGGHDVILKASVNRSTVATVRIQRQSPAAVGVTSRDFRLPADEIHGTLFLPKDTSVKKPAVLVFGGSEGGLNPAVTAKAGLLAAHGFAALALAYFNAPGLPNTLTAIPLEYFTKALSVLRAQPGVDANRVFVRGASRGGEASLLLASYFPQLVNGVVAEVPGSYVGPSFATLDRSAWKLGGRELPYARLPSGWPPTASVDPRKHIPVERIRGPIMLTCGDLDLVWPSCRNVEDMAARLAAHRFAYPVTVRRYADAGHFVGAFPPYTSITNSWLDKVGGTQAGTQAATVEVHAKVLALLAQPS
ncbi:MAG TPA: acyl-CoA thioester hydrolase/BAAT C-terminal domain-containing protein [Jiangellales bacterium]|nr:acyl-CoA thioester hydrolase/BAAT C-terminal domain-containing protein [Jiangellales bacterium]